MNALTGVALMALSGLPLLQAYRRGVSARGTRRRRHSPEPREWPRVSVIIPAWEERGTLEACLLQLRRVDYPDVEIIVAAGGTDGTFEAARRMSAGDGRMRVLPQRATGGKNGAMNDAARVATGEILVFLDADSIAAPGWLKALVSALSASHAASTGRLVPSRRTLVSRMGEMSQTLEYEARGRVSLQGSGSMAVRRAAWAAVGDLPEGPYADDWDLNARLRHAGFRVGYAPEAEVQTERPATLAQWWANELRWRRIHLASLFRLAAAEMPDARSAARALYPYIVGWTVVALAAVALALRLAGRGSCFVESAGLLVAGPALAREVGGAVETAAYTGETEWLRQIAVIPALTALGWGAAVVASLTSRRAPVHFKGPRPGRGAEPLSENDA